MQAHGEDLRALTNDAKFAEQIKRDYRNAKLDTKTRALCDFAAKVTRKPASVGGPDIVSLRKRGWRDEQIHDAAQVIALFNYYTRLADALGVEPEDFMPPRPARSRRGKKI